MSDQPDALAVRVTRLEQDVSEIRATMAQMVQVLIRIDATLTAVLPTLATKAELADLRAELKGDLADKPGKAYLVGLLAVLLTAYAAGLAALAIIK